MEAARRRLLEWVDAKYYNPPQKKVVIPEDANDATRERMVQEAKDREVAARERVLLQAAKRWFVAQYRNHADPDGLILTDLAQDGIDAAIAYKLALQDIQRLHTSPQVVTKLFQNTEIDYGHPLVPPMSELVELAAATNNHEMLEHLLDIYSGDRLPAWRAAALNCSGDALATLITKGGVHPNSEGRIALLTAAKRNNASVITMLVERFGATCKPTFVDVRNPLAIACRNRALEAITALLKFRTMPVNEDAMVSAIMGGSDEVVELVLQQGVSCSRGWGRVVAKLVEHGRLEQAHHVIDRVGKKNEH